MKIIANFSFFTLFVSVPQFIYTFVLPSSVSTGQRASNSKDSIHSRIRVLFHHDKEALMLIQDQNAPFITNRVTILTENTDISKIRNEENLRNQP